VTQESSLTNIKSNYTYFYIALYDFNFRRHEAHLCEPLSQGLVVVSQAG